MPVMVTRGVSKLISDSGLVRYKIISEEWRVYDKTTPQRQEFLRGIYFQRFSTKFTPDLDLMRRTFRFVADYEGEIPGAAPRDCGNWLLHDLPMARLEARRYVEEVLDHATDENLHYPE